MGQSSSGARTINTTGRSPSFTSSEMAHLFHWPSSICMASLLLISTLLLSFVSPSLCRSQYSSCFRSCHRCAKACIRRKGEFKAVCTDLHSIKNFLDLASLVDYDWAESNGV